MFAVRSIKLKIVTMYLFEVTWQFEFGESLVNYLIFEGMSLPLILYIQLMFIGLELFEDSLLCPRFSKVL